MSHGNLTPIMELSWKSPGILLYSFRGNPGPSQRQWSCRELPPFYRIFAQH